MEIILAMNEILKNIYGCPSHFTSVDRCAEARTEHRMNKLHIILLVGYRKFEFMMLCAVAALPRECSYYYVNKTRCSHVQIL